MSLPLNRRDAMKAAGAVAAGAALPMLEIHAGYSGSSASLITSETIEKWYHRLKALEKPTVDIEVAIRLRRPTAKQANEATEDAT